MTVGYARVSTTNQHLDMQLDALTASGCTRIHTDCASGALTARPGLDQALAELDDGDTLVVWRLDRLGRSLPHLVATIDNLTHRGVNLKSLHEAIDTTTPTGRLMVHLIASLAEFERELTIERTIAGIVHGRIDDEPPPWDNLMALTPPSQRKEAIRHAFFREPQALIIPNPVILHWHHTVHPNPLTYDRAGKITGGGWVTPTDTWTLTLKTLTHTGADPTAATSWRVPADHLADLTETITHTPDQPPLSATELTHVEDQLLARACLNRTHLWTSIRDPLDTHTPFAI